MKGQLAPYLVDEEPGKGGRQEDGDGAGVDQQEHVETILTIQLIKQKFLVYFVLMSVPSQEETGLNTVICM